MFSASAIAGLNLPRRLPGAETVKLNPCMTGAVASRATELVGFCAPSE